MGCINDIDPNFKVSIYASLEYQYIYDEAIRHQWSNS